MVDLAFANLYQIRKPTVRCRERWARRKPTHQASPKVSPRQTDYPTCRWERQVDATAEYRLNPMPRRTDHASRGRTAACGTEALMMRLLVLAIKPTSSSSGERRTPGFRDR